MASFKELAPLLLGGAVGAVSPRTGKSLAQGLGMMDQLKQRNRAQGIQDERLVRERQRDTRSKKDQAYQDEQRALVDKARTDAMALAATPDEEAVASANPSGFLTARHTDARYKARQLDGVYTPEEAKAMEEEMMKSDNPHFGRSISLKVKDGDKVRSVTLYPKTQKQGGGITFKDTVRYRDRFIDADAKLREAVRGLEVIEEQKKQFYTRPDRFRGETGKTMGQLLMEGGDDSLIIKEAGSRMAEREKKEGVWAEEEARLRTQAEQAESLRSTYGPLAGIDLAEEEDRLGNEVGTGAGQELLAQYGVQ